MSRGESPVGAEAAARRRASLARERARRAGEAADRQEFLAARNGRDIHLRAAEAHRQVAARHTASALLQDAFGDRLATWRRRRDERPLFMAGVAEACHADGAALTLVGQDRAQLAVAASDDAARAAQELEFILEEGPAWDALDLRGPVSATGVPALERRWPGYGPELAGLGLTGVFAMPLQTRGRYFGALTLYDPGPEPSGFALCAEVAEALTHTVLLGPDPDPELYGNTDHRDVVHQAAGALSVQLGGSVSDALALIKARAFADGVSTDTVARQILARPGETGPDGSR